MIDRPIVLGTSSPRRHEIMKMAGYEFTIKKAEVEETYPPELEVDEIPVFLAHRKADYFLDEIGGKIIITCDTIVALNNQVLGKPENRIEAEVYLNQLSGNSHEVISGVCLMTRRERISFNDKTVVKFRSISDQEIKYYLDHYKPYDKAGAYGIQEWIGMIGIESIQGSFYNVMGLPIHKVYSGLKQITGGQDV